MAVTSTKTTLSPYRFVLGGPIYGEDAQQVAEMLNWLASARNTQLHVSKTVAPAGWVTDAPKAHDQTFRAALTNVYWIPVRVVAETLELGVGASVDGLTGVNPAGDEVAVTFTAYDSAGSSLDSATLTFNGTAENQIEKTDTIDTTITGTGLLIVGVATQATNAGGVGKTFRTMRIQDGALSAGQLGPPPLEGDAGELIVTGGP